jgi:hypothetical protein
MYTPIRSLFPPPIRISSHIHSSEKGKISRDTLNENENVSVSSELRKVELASANRGNREEKCGKLFQLVINEKETFPLPLPQPFYKN